MQCCLFLKGQCNSWRSPGSLHPQQSIRRRSLYLKDCWTIGGCCRCLVLSLWGEGEETLIPRGRLGQSSGNSRHSQGRQRRQHEPQGSLAVPPCGLLRNCACCLQRSWACPSPEAWAVPGAASPFQCPGNDALPAWFSFPGMTQNDAQTVQGAGAGASHWTV